jgi:hypothetical protein
MSLISPVLEAPPDISGAWAERASWWRARADPLADRAVAALAPLPPSEREALVSRALAEGIETVLEAPDALRDLFAHVDAVPEWMDPARCDLGGYTFLRCRMGFVILACQALPLVYSLPTLNKALVGSGRLVDAPAVRLKETLKFILTTCRRGGLHRAAEGFGLTVRVRLVHARVRQLLRESGRWDPAWGEPISQWHLAVTNTIFSEAALEGLRRLGYRFQAEEREALVHLWRYSGYLLGIAPELSCESLEDARRLRAAAFDLEGPPDDDSRALVRGVMEAAHAWTRFVSPRLPYAISRSLIGDALAEALGYPRTAWGWVVPACRPVANAIEVARERNVPGVRALAAVCGTQMFNLLMSDRGLPGAMGNFDLPDRLPAARREAGPR